MKATANHILENETSAFLEAVKAQGGEPIYKLSPVEARKVLEELQSKPVAKPPVKIDAITLPQSTLSLRIVTPKESRERLHPLLYFHGGGWILGSFATHERLMCELAVGAPAAVVFVNYTSSPEARFPEVVEECYTALKYVAEHGRDLGLDTKRLAVSGDSAGGNLAIALTLLAKERKGPKIDGQVLFYPVTSADRDTPSYKQFAEGYWLTKPAMDWFFDAYAPDAASQKNRLVSPVHIPIDQLKGLPPALIITAENDVLRDEGEEYAHRLTQAKVPVTAMRALGTIHDFAMLNPLAKTPPARGAIALANQFIHNLFK